MHVRVARGRGRRDGRGQSMVELALIVPIVAFFLLAAVDFARVTNAQQRLEHAAHLASLVLVTDPSYKVSATLAQYIQKQSGLPVGAVTASASYSVNTDGAYQVTVIADYDYPMLLPGVQKLRTRVISNGLLHISVRAAGIAATDPPSVSDTGGTIRATPPSGVTVPTPLAGTPTPTLICSLFRNGAAVPTPQPCTSATWLVTPTPGVSTNAYTTTAMQSNSIVSPPGTPVIGP